jgi:glycerophosphoryl diester phosphodiesterase
MSKKKMRLQNPSPSSRPDFLENINPPVAVAHRGGDAAGADKENSLAAFKAAYKLGYRWFETDVVATKDKKLLAIHGRGWQLRPNKDLPMRSTIRRLNYSQVKKIKIGDQAVPLLEDILREFPDIKIFVDPKTFRSVPALVELLTKHPDDINRVYVGAFSKIRTIRVAHLVKQATGKEVYTSILGPLNAYPIYLGARINFLKPFIKYYVQETNAHILKVPYRWITNSPKAGHKLVQFAHELGLVVGVYTPNSQKSIEKSLAGGVDMVLSDRVALLMKLINSKHKK